MTTSSLTLLTIWLQKLALLSKEDIDWEAIVAAKKQDIVLIHEPFPHVVVDNFFTDKIYTGLCAEFKSILSRGTTESIADRDHFHRFDMDYDGYLYMPRVPQTPQHPMHIFFSLEWNLFFSKLFGQRTGFETSLAYHFHPPHNRTGFVHNDYADKLFIPTTRLPNGVVPYATLDKERGIPKRRIIALLYFLENDGWKEGDGGETGLYAHDGKTLVKKVAPRNNRLLAFHISPHSFHAFQENMVNRNSFVQWFHIPYSHKR